MKNRRHQAMPFFPAPADKSDIRSLDRDGSHKVRRETQVEKGPLWSLFERCSLSPFCLIEGCLAPSNTAALGKFLARRGIFSPRICAIDLYDLKSILLAAGLPLPNVEFLVADAANLKQVFRDGQVDILVQDFLLNCAPHRNRKQILAEAARILDPQGIVIFSVTDYQCLDGCERITRHQLEKRHGITVHDDAYCVRDLAPNTKDLSKLLTALAGKVIVDGPSDQFTLITAPNGNIEFFTTFANIETAPHRAGFGIACLDTTKGKDNNGLMCMRHRCILRKRLRHPT